MKRKSEKRRLSFMLVAALVVTVILGFVPATPASAHWEDLGGTPETYKVVKSDGTIQGKLTSTDQKLYYQFSCDGPAQVELSKDVSSPKKICTQLYGADGDFLNSGDLKSVPDEMYVKDRFYYYVIGGTYYLEVSAWDSSMLGKFSLHMNVTPVHDTFVETEDDFNDFSEMADSIQMDRVYFGSICTDEPGADINKGYADCYTFDVYYDNCPVELNFTTNMADVAFAIFRKDGVQIQDNTNHLGTWDFSFANRISGQYQWTLNRGTYYFDVWTIGAHGEYYFSFRDRSGLEILELDPIYLTPTGRTGTFSRKEKNTLGNPSMNWDSMNDEVAHVNSSDKIVADRAGSTTLVGRGYRQTDNVAVKYHRDVIVEYKDVIHAADPADNTYFYDAVYWATNAGIAMGYPDKNGVYMTFGPTKECTRAQIVTFLWRMAGCPEPISLPSDKIGARADGGTLSSTGAQPIYGNGGACAPASFMDITDPSTYYYKAVIWAAENGITDGYKDGTFRPQNVCTRSQIVTFLWRMAGCPEPFDNGNVSVPGGSLGQGTFTLAPNFKDNKDTGTYYYKAVLWACANGITEGYPDGTFRPANKCTRSQCVTFLYRYDNKFGPKG